MIERHIKFLEYVEKSVPEINANNLKSLEEKDLSIVYSKKVYGLLFRPECDRMAPMNINSKSVWLRAAAVFRLSNPL